MIKLPTLGNVRPGSVDLRLRDKFHVIGQKEPNSIILQFIEV